LSQFVTPIFGDQVANESPFRAATMHDVVWLAAYTTPRHEKSVARHFDTRGVEYFLPLHKAVHRWKNGCKVVVESPLFPSYIFARTERKFATRLLDVPGVLAVVGAGRNASAIPDQEIEVLRSELPLRKFEPHAHLLVGSKVRIASGPMLGICGILVRKKTGLRVVLSVDIIRQSVAVEVDADEVEPI